MREQKGVKMARGSHRCKDEGSHIREGLENEVIIWEFLENKLLILGLHFIEKFSQAVKGWAPFHLFEKVQSERDSERVAANLQKMYGWIDEDHAYRDLASTEIQGQDRDKVSGSNHRRVSGNWEMTGDTKDSVRKLDVLYITREDTHGRIYRAGSCLKINRIPEDEKMLKSKLLMVLVVFFPYYELESGEDCGRR